MSEPLVHPNTAHVARVLGLPLSTVSSQVQNGHFSGVAKKPGPGRREHRLTAPQVLEVIIFNQLRMLGADNKLLSERAAAATRAALPNLLAAVRGELKESPGYLLFVLGEQGEQSEERIFCKNFEELEWHTHDALMNGRVPVPLRLKTVFEKLFRAFALAESNPALTMPSATTIGPDTTDARGPGGVDIRRIRAADPAATGLAVGLEGVTTFHQGHGLQVALSPALMREMAKRLEAVAHELENRPRAEAAASWQLAGEVAGSA